MSKLKPINIFELHGTLFEFRGELHYVLVRSTDSGACEFEVLDPVTDERTLCSDDEYRQVLRLLMSESTYE